MLSLSGAGVGFAGVGDVGAGVGAGVGDVASVCGNYNNDDQDKKY